MTAQQDRIRTSPSTTSSFRVCGLPLSVPFAVAAWWNLLPSTKPTAVSAQTVELALVPSPRRVVPIRAYYRPVGRVPALPWRSACAPGRVCRIVDLAEAIRELPDGNARAVGGHGHSAGSPGLQAGGLRQHYVWIACACFVLWLSVNGVYTSVRAMELNLLLAGGS
jgi:hypothetical protein